MERCDRHSLCSHIPRKPKTTTCISILIHKWTYIKLVDVALHKNCTTDRPIDRAHHAVVINLFWFLYIMWITMISCAIKFDDQIGRRRHILCTLKGFNLWCLCDGQIMDFDGHVFEEIKLENSTDWKKVEFIRNSKWVFECMCMWMVILSHKRSWTTR